MLEFFSPSCGYIAEQFQNKIKFFTRDKFTTKAVADVEEKQNEYVYLLAFIVALVINVSIMYYALKIACSEGFDVKNFLMAYFLTLPYLLYKLFMKKCTK
jgi:hypothetical protein